MYKNPNDESSGTTDEDQEKAEILSKFYSSVFTNEPIGHIPQLQPRTILHIMKELVITEEEIEKKLKKLKSNKSPGIDEFNPTFLKNAASSILKPLQIIFNKSLQDGCLPLDWKKARISAIYKNKGDKKMAGNYRPVSLTSIICKLLESIIKDHIINFMKENSLFSKKQYGFLSGRSTTLQLLAVMDAWTEALDHGYDVDVVYMDYLKAFDTVPHLRLLNKIKAYKVHPQIQNWIHNFLSNRSQQVCVRDKASKWEAVTSGIPQGSVLGPLLFVLFINDLPETVMSDVYLFADDTKIFRKIKSEEDREGLQRDLKTLEEWSNTWLLRFHPDKCKHMHIGSKNIGDKTYRLLGHNLEAIDEEKDLGIIIDSKLDFDTHICEKVKKANQMFGLLRRTFEHMDSEVFLPLYKTMVRTHLEYGNAVWHPNKIKHIEQLENVQRRATKQLPGMSNLSYPERLKKLELPTLSYRRLRGDLIETYKIMNGVYDQEPASFLTPWTEATDVDGLRGHSKKLFLQRANSCLRQNNFSIRTVKIWNSLPEEIVSASSTDSFKNRLDTYMQDQDIVYDDFKAEVQLAQR